MSPPSPSSVTESHGSALIVGASEAQLAESIANEHTSATVIALGRDIRPGTRLSLIHI